MATTAKKTTTDATSAPARPRATPRPRAKAVIRSPEADALPVPASDPAPAPAEPTPGELCRAELTAFTEHVLLARRLVLDSPGVGNQQMCADGVGEFMIRSHLVPWRGSYGGDHPAVEPTGNIARAEAAIRTWCARPLGGDVEDYSDAGLGKRLDAVRTAHAAWQTEFRERCIASHRRNSSYISVERMAEVFPQLGIEPWEPMRRVELTVTYDYMIPARQAGDDPIAFGRQVRERLLAALGELAGEASTREGCLYTDASRYVNVGVYSQ
jgi:hypothetical protein